MKSQLLLESLEARETPSSLRHQMFSIVDRTRMLGDDVVVDGRIITAENYDSTTGTFQLTFNGQTTTPYSAIVFVGGWGSSMYQYSYGGSY